ncbi:uncharacterized protein LOC141489217 [Macrotis lagotis]|uniref:uncharacterized protein LOC141489217 n=1 Tax=Macrotis lagotis TaxID=92651 RepID=UPI003D69B9FF
MPVPPQDVPWRTHTRQYKAKGVCLWKRAHSASQESPVSHPRGSTSESKPTQPAKRAQCLTQGGLLVKASPLSQPREPSVSPKGVYLWKRAHSASQESPMSHPRGSTSESKLTQPAKRAQCLTQGMYQWKQAHSASQESPMSHPRGSTSESKLTQPANRAQCLTQGMYQWKQAHSASQQSPVSHPRGSTCGSEPTQPTKRAQCLTQGGSTSESKPTQPAKRVQCLTQGGLLVKASSLSQPREPSVSPKGVY